jgi:hypothetical protein
MLALTLIWGGVQGAAAETTIKPLLELEASYSDNFYRSQENTSSAWEWRISPGVDYEWASDRSSLSMNFMLNGYLYSGGSDERDVADDDYLGVDLELGGLTTFGERLKVGITDTFNLTRESAAADRFYTPVDRDLYWVNQVEPFVSYDFQDYGTIRLAYRNNAHRFIDPVEAEQAELGSEPGVQDETSKNDSMEHRGILTLTYNLSDTQYFDLEGSLWRRNYEGDQAGYDSIQVLLFYRHEFNEYLSGEAGVGYHDRDYDEDEWLEDWDGLVYKVSFTGKSDITVIRCSLEHNLNDFTIGDIYYEATRINLYLEREILDHIRLGLGGYYQFSDYQPPSEREDEWLNVNGKVGYIFWDRQAEAYIRISYTNRDSNLANLDYDETLFLVGVSFDYDLSK